MTEYAHLNPSTRAVSYTATGTTNQFYYPFPIWSADGLEVYLDDAPQQPTAYSISGIGSASGGTVTFNATPASGTIVSLLGSTMRERAVDYNQYVTLTAKSMNLDNDVQEAQIQENTTALKRTMITPPSDGISPGPLMLPTRQERKESYLAFDAAGNPVPVGDSANVVRGMRYSGTTPHAIMLWGDASGLQAADSHRLFGAANGAATLDDAGLVPDSQLPPRGHSISNATNPIPYRKNLDFSDEFTATSSTTSTNIKLSLRLVNVGSGPADTIANYDGHGILRPRTITGEHQINVRLLPDGTIGLSTDFSPKEYHFPFTADNWDGDNRITILPAQHGLGEDDRLLCTVRNDAGDDVLTDVNVSGGGVVTLATNEPFPGSVMIYGGYGASAADMVNPMLAKGDVIFCSAAGTPTRLPIGAPNQALCAGQDGTPQYATLGECAWMHPNTPHGPVLLDDNLEVPEQYLPINTMSYKGTFGSEQSTTGGDLPAYAVLDGDIFIADSEYYSAVAGIHFSAGEWAIHYNAAWTKIPSLTVHTSPVGSVIAHAGSAVPDHYLACNGYQLLIANYPQLYAAIGASYNTGAEPTGYFSIPNYNGERVFLQGHTTVGTKLPPGLPNITGSFPFDSNGGGWVNGAFQNAGQAKGASGGSWNNNYATFDASRSSTVYGGSTTVQPPARTVLYLIKYI